VDYLRIGPRVIPPYIPPALGRGKGKGGLSEYYTGQADLKKRKVIKNSYEENLFFIYLNLE